MAAGRGVGVRGVRAVAGGGVRGEPGPAGGDGEFYAAAAGTPHPSRLRRATFPSRGRLWACGIQHLPLKGKANEDVSFDDISLANGWYADLLCQHLDIPVAFRDTFW